MARIAMSFVLIGLLTLASAQRADSQTAPPAPVESDVTIEPRTDLATIDEAIKAVRQAEDPVVAIRAFEAGRRIDANSTALYEAYIRALVEWGQFDLAYQPAQELVDLDSAQGLGWAVLAHRAAQENSPSLAVWAASKAAEYHNDEPFVLETVARVAAWYRWQRDQQGGNASVDGQVDALVSALVSNGVFSGAYLDAEAFYEALEEDPDAMPREPDNRRDKEDDEPDDQQAARQPAQEAVERHYYYYYAPSSGYYGGGYPYFHGYDYASPHYGHFPYYGRIYIGFGYFHPFGHGYYDYYPYRRYVYPRYHHHRFYHDPRHRDRDEPNPHRQRFPHERKPWPQKRHEEIRDRLQRRYYWHPGSRRSDRDEHPRATRPSRVFGKPLTTKPLATPKHSIGNRLELLRQLRRRQHLDDPPPAATPGARVAPPRKARRRPTAHPSVRGKTVQPVPTPVTRGHVARPDAARMTSEALAQQRAARQEAMMRQRTQTRPPANKMEALRRRRR